LAAPRGYPSSYADRLDSIDQSEDLHRYHPGIFKEASPQGDAQPQATRRDFNPYPTRTPYGHGYLAQHMRLRAVQVRRRDAKTAMTAPLRYAVTPFLAHTRTVPGRQRSKSLASFPAPLASSSLPLPLFRTSQP
jgi:hypothetical protein